MKQFILIALCLLVIPTAASAAGKRALQVFDNVSTVNAVSATMDAQLYPDLTSWELVIATGSPSAYNISIQGSIRCRNSVADADSWHGISELTETITATDGFLRHVALKPVRCLRAKLNSVTGGGSFDVYVLPKL